MYKTISENRVGLLMYKTISENRVGLLMYKTISENRVGLLMYKTISENRVGLLMYKTISENRVKYKPISENRVLMYKTISRSNRMINNVVFSLRHPTLLILVFSSTFYLLLSVCLSHTNSSFKRLPSPRVKLICGRNVARSLDPTRIAR